MRPTKAGHLGRNCFFSAAVGCNLETSKHLNSIKMIIENKLDKDLAVSVYFNKIQGLQENLSKILSQPQVKLLKSSYLDFLS